MYKPYDFDPGKRYPIVAYADRVGGQVVLHGAIRAGPRALEQLADRHGFVDVERVGIYGHSGGGFMSTAAMLAYPDFFKVAVSLSGSHNNDVYNRWWSETHHGVKEVVSDSGVDNNVHHAGTFRMADALIKANKRFDFFVFPGQRHGYGNMGDYWYWLRGEYFVKHLLGDTQWSADITQLQVEQPKGAR